MKIKTVLYALFIAVLTAFFSLSATAQAPSSPYNSSLPMSGGYGDVTQTFRNLIRENTLSRMYVADYVDNATWVLIQNADRGYQDFQLRTNDTAFTPYTNTGTTSITKAHFDAFLYSAMNNIITCATEVNRFGKRIGLPYINLWHVSTATATVSSATYAKGTGNTYTGVKYTSSIIANGTNATAGSSSLVDATSANFAWQRLVNNVQSLAVGANRLGYNLGAAPIRYATRGTAQVSSDDGMFTRQVEIQDVTTTSAAVTGGAGDQTISETNFEAQAVILSQNINTIAKYLKVLLRGDDLRYCQKLRDSSGGTASAATLPGVTEFTTIAAFDHVTGADLTQYSSFNSAVTIIENDMSVIANLLNEYSLMLSLPLIRNTIQYEYYGTIADATVAAVSTTVGAVAGTASDALAYTEASVICTQLEYDVYKLANATNNIMLAFGRKPLDIQISIGNTENMYEISRQTDATSGTEGDDTDGVQNTVMNAWAADMANNLATICARLIEIQKLKPLKVPPTVFLYN